MAKDIDVAGLMDHLDKVNYDHIPLVFQYLTELSENGYYDKVISHGAIPRAIETMHSGSGSQKKSAMFLIYSLISHGRCEIVVSNDDLIENLLGLLGEEEETETDRGVAYCMSMLCPLGGAEEFIKRGGIGRLAPLMKNDDELTTLYTLFTLNTISSMGYQMEILETKINKLISYHMPENKEIETLSQMLLDDLYNWREESFIVGEEELEIFDQSLEVIGIDDGYLRPDIQQHRIEPRDGKILGYDGKEIAANNDKEVIIELKRRKLENYKKLKNKDQEMKDTFKNRRKKAKEKVKDEAGPVGKKRVKQRVVKKKPVVLPKVERKVVNVITGPLDKPGDQDPQKIPDTPVQQKAATGQTPSIPSINDTKEHVQNANELKT